MTAHTPHTFKDWLAQALAEDDVRVRELARRMASRHPRGISFDTIESSRSTLKKILAGKQNPTQPTRDSIQAALDRDDAPTAEDEASDAPTAAEALAQLREMRKQMRIFERVLIAGAQ